MAGATDSTPALGEYPSPERHRIPRRRLIGRSDRGRLLRYSRMRKCSLWLPTPRRYPAGEALGFRDALFSGVCPPNGRPGLSKRTQHLVAAAGPFDFPMEYLLFKRTSTPSHPAGPPHMAGCRRKAAVLQNPRCRQVVLVNECVVWAASSDTSLTTEAVRENQAPCSRNDHRHVCRLCCC